MSEYPPYDGLWTYRTEHPTARWRRPAHPNQVVIDLNDADAWVDEPVPYWTAERITISSYEDLAVRLSPFDMMSEGDVSFWVGDTSAYTDPPNPLASLVWVIAGLGGNARFGTPMPGLPDRPHLLYGPCLIAGPADEDGNTMSCPEWVFDVMPVLTARSEGR